MDMVEGNSEELDKFDDFTLASSWERFISEIEATCRIWLIDGPKNLWKKGATHAGSLSKVKKELMYGTKRYCMELFCGKHGDRVEWGDGLHDLQLAFGIKEFLVLAPVSASGVVLDAPEASKLLSSVAIALSSCGSYWPAFVPVHDPTREAFLGIHILGATCTRRFEVDRIGSQVPVKLMHLEGLYELFLSKFAFSMIEFSSSFFKVNFSMKLTYRTPPLDDEYEIPESESVNRRSQELFERQPHSRAQWDDDCPWAEWYSAEDPIKGFELVCIWSKRTIGSSLEMAELENSSPVEADRWLLRSILSSDQSNFGETLVGFSSQLRLLVNALECSFRAHFMEDFISAEISSSDNLRTISIPPPSVLDRVLKNIFCEGEPTSDYTEGEQMNSRGTKGAPLFSLFSQFCLHCLWFGDCNIRAISLLWIEFVREVRWYWEESQPLPRTSASGGVNLSTCLIHQKLQMLAICITMKGIKGPDVADFSKECNSPLESGLSHALETSEVDQNPSKQERKGSAGFAGSMMLLNSRERMHVPYTQDAPIMTEDMHEERLQALEVFGSTLCFSAQLEQDVLSSDMSAFKAANPNATFEDFIRWYSPGDWEEDNENRTHADISDDFFGDTECDAWPPSGRLSHRMSKGGNLWRQIWTNSLTLPICEQKPILDPNREGEKVLHYLETLRPHQLLGQMVCTAFKASVDTLGQISFRDLVKMHTKIEQFYLAMSSTLKSLKVNNMSEMIDSREDLIQLCVVFEHVEKLLIFSASLYQKLFHSPRLIEAVFNDFFDFFILMTEQDMVDREKIHKVWQRIESVERPIVARLFPPPTANQSWRKVLSMGNLFNGNEPASREIVFYVHDSMCHDSYESDKWGSHQEVETYRMYICGTSNDLQVALSVTSCD